MKWLEKLHHPRPFHLHVGKSCVLHMLPQMLPYLYIGETGRSLRSRFGEHLRNIRNNTPGCPVAQHFNYHRCQGGGMRLCRGTNILRKQLETKLIFQLGTLQPGGLNINFNMFELYARYFLHARSSI